MDSDEQKKIGGEVFVIIAGICWGLIGLFTRRMSLFGLDSIQITFLRNLFSAIILVIYVLIKDRDSLKFELKDIWMFLGTGICSIALFNICYFKTIEIAGLSIAAILLYTAPAMVVVMSGIIFKEKFTVNKVIALILAFCGCIFTAGIIGDDNSVSTLGVIIGLMSGFGYALYSIFGTFAAKKYSTLTITLYTFTFAVAALAPFSKLGSMAHVVSDNKSIILVAVGLAIISTIVPFLCYTTGLKRMEAGKASIMAFIEPLVATIIGITVFGETLTIFNIIGIMLIFVSVILINKKNNKKSPEL